MVNEVDFQVAAQIVRQQYREAKNDLIHNLGELGRREATRIISYTSYGATSPWFSQPLLVENSFVAFFSGTSPRFDEKSFRAACRKDIGFPE